MKLLVISDSHGYKINNEIIDFENCDYNIHCGDSQLAYSDSEMRNFDLKVQGNCDFDKNYPKQDFLNTKYGKIMATHGHYFSVNYGLTDLARFAENEGCSIAFYGHTHVVVAEKVNDVILINPGSIAQSRSRYPKTYAVVEIKEQSNVTVHIKDASTYQEIETIEL